MKAIIIVDVPEHQIGQEVSVHFEDTMCVKSVCTPLTFLKYRMKDYVFYNVDWLKERWEMEMKLLGVDFSKHDEEVIKETVESVWGKPPYIEHIDKLIDKCMETLFDATLDKIRAEIEQYQADCDLSCSDDANCRICDKITFDTIYRIIDKYRKGQTDADSD